MATTSNEEIIEKSATAPIATSCLVIACVALIGAIAFQIAEIASYKTGVAEPAMTPRKGVAQDMADKYIAGLRKDVQAALDTSVRGGAAGLDRSFDRDLEPAPGDLPDEPADAMEEPEEEPADEPEEEDAAE